MDDSPSHFEHCGSVRIIRNSSYTTRTQMLKVKEKLTILELKRTRFLCHDCGLKIRRSTIGSSDIILLKDSTTLDLLKRRHGGSK
ncbi:hypothetical protein EGB_22500 [Enterococcus gallinarum]